MSPAGRQAVWEMLREEEISTLRQVRKNVGSIQKLGSFEKLKIGVRSELEDALEDLKSRGEGVTGGGGVSGGGGGSRAGASPAQGEASPCSEAMGEIQAAEAAGDATCSMADGRRMKLGETQGSRVSPAGGTPSTSRTGTPAVGKTGKCNCGPAHTCLRPTCPSIGKPPGRMIAAQTPRAPLT